MSHVEYAPRVLLRLEQDGTNRQTDARRGQRNDSPRSMFPDAESITHYGEIVKKNLDSHHLLCLLVDAGGLPVLRAARADIVVSVLAVVVYGDEV